MLKVTSMKAEGSQFAQTQVEICQVWTPTFFLYYLSKEKQPKNSWQNLVSKKRYQFMAMAKI